MDVKIIRSNRKTIGIQINSDLSVVVRAPKRVSKREIERVLKEKEAWIIKSIDKMQQRKAELEANSEPPIAMDELKKLANHALEYIPKRVKYFAPIVGVDYGRITIRNQKTRWGSCSGKGNLNFNCLLMLAPTEVIDYVVVHELCHRIEMNHSKAFWSEVERVLPDYKSAKKWLKDNGEYIMQRIKKNY
ncbi:MAG: SprT family zinc-dependent metalloprotease [Eubacteriales bacterium]|nr:SprT family zinc-dependent metalloprotease [Eubacteriales bacterium]